MPAWNRNDFAVQFVGPTSVIAEHFGDLRHLNPAIPDRFACDQRFKPCQRFVKRQNRPGDILHNITAFCGGIPCGPVLLHRCREITGLSRQRRSAIGIAGKFCLRIGVFKYHGIACAIAQLATDKALDRFAKAKVAHEREQKVFAFRHDRSLRI